MTDDRFERAALEARAMLHASAAAEGIAAATGPAADNLVILLRIVGPNRATACEHLMAIGAGDEAIPVFAHAALGAHHVCSECAASPEVVQQIRAFVPTHCNSCGEPAEALWQIGFQIDNIVVGGYVCDECHDGKRAVVPEWTRQLPES